MAEIHLSELTSAETINYSTNDSQVEIQVVFEDFKDRYESWGSETPMDSKAVKSFTFDLSFIIGASLSNNPVVINEFKYKVIGIEWRSTAIDLFLEITDLDILQVHELPEDSLPGPASILSSISPSRKVKLTLARSYSQPLTDVTPLMRIMNGILGFLGFSSKRHPQPPKNTLPSLLQAPQSPPAHNRQHIIQVNTSSEFFPDSGRNYYRGYGENLDTGGKSFFLLTEEQNSTLQFLLQDKLVPASSPKTYQNLADPGSAYVGSFHFRGEGYNADDITGGIANILHELTDGVYLPHEH